MAGGARQLAVALGVLLLGLGGCGSPSPAPAPARVPAPPAPSPLVAGIAAPAGARAALYPRAIPLRLRIPAIGVDAPVQRLGVLGSGALGVPDNWTSVGWYPGGPAPGQPGEALIDGHLDSYTAPAVFWRLRQLRPGEAITVDTSRGGVLTFTVQRLQAIPYQEPLGPLLHSTGTPGLELITCAGTWLPGQQIYNQRLLVTAVLTATAVAAPPA